MPSAIKSPAKTKTGTTRKKCVMCGEQRFAHGFKKNGGKWPEVCFTCKMKRFRILKKVRAEKPARIPEGFDPGPAIGKFESMQETKTGIEVKISIKKRFIAAVSSIWKSINRLP